jgi:bifunctional non-homologous end joining protein LigD
MASWAEPRFVCEVEFRHWTHDGLIRQASFKGLREDKLPDDISLEAPRRSKSRTYIGIAGVGLTHPERILWPEPNKDWRIFTPLLPPGFFHMSLDGS